MQLVMKDVFEKDAAVNRVHSKVMTVVYQSLADFAEHKDGALFMETADMLTSSILRNRTQQATRWARALLCCLVAFIRNAGTIYSVLGKKALEAATVGDLTKHREINQRIAKLREAKFWLYVIGYCQIFDRLVQASLEAQHGSYCSSSSLHLVYEAMDRIKQLGKLY